ncbi:T9SS type A sorting domain-containing protein [Legionella shakespearei]|uniref:Tpr n=1 Tax=Legionella shakespearei DSM 23087 TaxID=1122169 RepID=A0A0W0YVD1_9GAMM|nr:T9SS type A sorting domain-containing protein [Legionella shakespearei]KTD60823.1 Tpr [Legionella shakespearei DSM 23087]
MRLAKFDIQHELKSQFNAILSSASFADLKTLVLDKTAISSVQKQIESLLSQAEKQDEADAVAALEKAAYDRQVKEDAAEKERDISARHADALTQSRLIREYEAIKQERSGLERELFVNELLVQSPGPTQTVVHQHPLSTPVVGTNLHTHINSFEIKRQLEERIAALSNRMVDIDLELKKLEQWNKDREKRREKRESRLQARLEYAQKGTGIAATLASDNQSRLLADIKTKKQEIQKNCTSLIAEAEQLNYSVFLNQLEIYLSHSNTRSAQENEALRNLLKLIRQNLIHDKEVISLKARLNRTIADLEQNQRSLQLTRQRLASLIQANPDLISENEQLTRDNNELSALQEEHVETRNSLFYKTLIFAGLTLASAIPLFLLLAGVIASTAVVSALIIVPPILLLAAGIGLSVATLVYAVKGWINGYSISTNEETINTNSARMVDNSNEIDTINNRTIPDFERAIARLKSNQEQLAGELRQTELRAADSFKQAQGVELPVYSGSSLFTGPVEWLNNPKNGPAKEISLPSAPLSDILDPESSPKDILKSSEPYVRM